MSIGKSFQSIGAMIEKALKLYVFKLFSLVIGFNNKTPLV